MLTSVAAWSRYQRDSMLDVLHTDYVRTARAKGVPRRQIIRRHALRNALIPFVTVVAIDAGVLLGGVVVVEKVFSWPGLGLLFFDALERSDYPVILAWMAVATMFVVLFNLLADILYGVLDPRIRVERAARPTREVARARMSMRDGRRVGAGAGRGDRPALLGAEPVRHRRTAAAVAQPRGGGSAATRWRWSGSGSSCSCCSRASSVRTSRPSPTEQHLLEPHVGAVVGRTGSAPTS